MHIQEVMVTPDMARSWLSTMSDDGNGNRKLRKHRARAYATEMSMGRWRVNGQCILINDAGKLIDGQHRLFAVILHGKPVNMLVMYGAPDGDGIVETLDSALVRNGSDAIHFHKPHIAFKPQAVSAITAAMVKYSRPLNGYGVLLPSAIRALVDKYEKDIFFVLDSAGNTAKPTTAPFLGVCARAHYHNVSEDLLSAFILTVKTGTPTERLAYEDTALLLGTILRDEKTIARSKSNVAQKITERTERALTAYLKCERLARIVPVGANPWPVTM